MDRWKILTYKQVFVFLHVFLFSVSNIQAVIVVTRISVLRHVFFKMVKEAFSTITHLPLFF